MVSFATSGFEIGTTAKLPSTIALLVICDLRILSSFHHVTRFAKSVDIANYRCRPSYTLMIIKVAVFFVKSFECLVYSTVAAPIRMLIIIWIHNVLIFILIQFSNHDCWE